MLTKQEFQTLHQKGIRIEQFTYIRMGVEMTLSTGEHAHMHLQLKDNEDNEGLHTTYEIPEGSTIDYAWVLEEVKHLFREHPHYRLPLLTADEGFFFFICERFTYR